MIDPRKQECLGQFGYGTGYFKAIRRVQEEMAARMGARVRVPEFCFTCPAMAACEAETLRRVEKALLVNPSLAESGWPFQQYAAAGRSAFARQASVDADLARVLAVSRRIG